MGDLPRNSMLAGLPILIIADTRDSVRDDDQLRVSARIIADCSTAMTSAFFHLMAIRS